MKNIKKLFSSILVLVVSLTSIMGLNAATGTITVNNAVVGQNYSIYRILELESYDKTNNNYIYRANSTWSGFVSTATDYLVAKSENGATYYTWKKGASESEFAKKALEYANSNSIDALSTKTATTTQVKFTGLSLGYYLVNSSVGSILHLTSTDPDGIVNEKNSLTPDIKKEVKEDSTGKFGSTNDASINDVVYFETTVTTGASYGSYKIYDKMDAGLTLNSSSIKLYTRNVVNGKDVDTLVDSTNYTINLSETGYTFSVSISDAYVSIQPVGTKLVLKYDAIVNENAVIEGSGNNNETYLTFGNDSETDKKKTTTYVYAFDLVKVDGNDKEKKLLNGAEFKLYASDGTTLINVVLKDATKNIYRVAVGNETGVTIKAGSAIIEGLDKDTYYLEEVVAPVGFNPLSSKVQFNVTAKSTDNTVARTKVTVENYSGEKLPETGGTGTLMFVTCGSVLVLAFGLILVTKLRAYKENI